MQNTVLVVMPPKIREIIKQKKLTLAEFNKTKHETIIIKKKRTLKIVIE